MSQKCHKNDTKMTRFVGQQQEQRAASSADGFIGGNQLMWRGEETVEREKRDSLSATAPVCKK